MGPYILTSPPAGLSSTSLTSTATPARLVLPTTTSEASVLDYASSTPFPTRSSGVLLGRWPLPSGCSFPGSHFTPPFARSGGFPTSWFSGSWDAGSNCGWLYTSSSASTSTSTSSLPSPTLSSPTRATTLSTNAIIGIAVGAGVVAILLATGLVFCFMQRRCRHDEFDSPRASLLPVAYPITRPRSARMSSSGVSTSPLSELHVVAPSKRTATGVLESKSLANCSVVPRLSVSSPLLGSVDPAAPALPEGPCRAEKALMQLRDLDRRPAEAVACEAALPMGGVCTASEPRPPKAIRARLNEVYGDDAELAVGHDGGHDVGFAADYFLRHSHSGLDLGSGMDTDLDSDANSRMTLPPPYSSHPSFEREAV